MKSGSLWLIGWILIIGAVSLLNSKFESIKLLWTGGWDSTYQLLHVLLHEKRYVEPFYLIDEGRKSTGAELLAMKNIRAKIFELDETARTRLLPTRLFLVSEIRDDPEIKNAFYSLRKRNPIGTQFEWLASYCKHHGVSRLQIGLEKQGSASAVVAPLIGKKNAQRIDEGLAGPDEFVLFNYFDFPIIELTKEDIGRIADENGWAAIMEMTWFCHRPIKGKPCARCSPCKSLLKKGLARRIPLQRRLVRELLGWFC